MSSLRSRSMSYKQNALLVLLRPGSGKLRDTGGISLGAIAAAYAKIGYEPVSPRQRAAVRRIM